jgi:leucyl aminopeptidase (aminopeptidase T)
MKTASTTDSLETSDMKDVRRCAARHLISHCGGMQAGNGETLLIVNDVASHRVAEVMVATARDMELRLEQCVIPEADTHGTDPPSDVARRMLLADLTIAITRFSLAHSEARLCASQNGRRFLSLPAFTYALLSDPAVRFDFKSQESLVRDIASRLTQGNSVRVTTKSGTDVQFNIEDRQGNACPGFVNDVHLLGSPPDVEANVSPIEDSANGTIIVDGSITCPEIGLLRSPVELLLSAGRMQSFSCVDDRISQAMSSMFNAVDSERRVLGECGLGLNPLARLTGIMLTDEGTMGSTHFGFGSNYTIGGRNKVDFHLDFVVRDTTVEVDGNPLFLEGKLVQ